MYWAIVLLSAFIISVNSQWPTTEPFWPHYPTRHIQVLDGIWDFAFDEKADPLKVVPSNIKTTDKMAVPQSFDIEQPGVRGRRGTAFYRTTVKTSSAKSNLLLYFAACSFYCRIFVDNVEIGEHRAGGYQPFWLNAPATSSSTTTREIFVISNNVFNSTLAPTHTGGDFYFYGGIIRNVLVHEQPAEKYLLQVETFTVDYNGVINARVLLGNSTGGDSAVLSLAWDSGTPSNPGTVNFKDGVANLNNLRVPNAKPWSLSEPNLHTLKVNLHDSSSHAIIDAITVRFGLRIVSIVKQSSTISRLAINDKVVKLHGVNRHTMWPDTGAAPDLTEIETDISLLLKLGANYVRGAHYPQDQRFLDRCDENGIAIWEEALGPGVSVKNIQDPYFMQHQVIAINEMISASINHPCIILQGFFNEGPSNEAAACPGYNTSSVTIRNRVGNPPTRLVTWASNQQKNDKCFDAADVISFNGYPGWYGNTHDLSAIVPNWEGNVQWIQKNWPQKPFFISEAGAGGIYEWNNNVSDPLWSQNYQSELLNITARFAVSTDGVSGITIWQFCDIKVDGSTPSCQYKPHPPSLSVPWDCEYIEVDVNNPGGRPGGENHKGVVDFWRRPKKSFNVLSEIYQNAEMQEFISEN